MKISDYVDTYPEEQHVETAPQMKYATTQDQVKAVDLIIRRQGSTQYSINENGQLTRYNLPDLQVTPGE